MLARTNTYTHAHTHTYTWKLGMLEDLVAKHTKSLLGLLFAPPPTPCGGEPPCVGDEWDLGSGRGSVCSAEAEATVGLVVWPDKNGRCVCVRVWVGRWVGGCCVGIYIYIHVSIYLSIYIYIYIYTKKGGEGERERERERVHIGRAYTHTHVGYIYWTCTCVR